MNNEKFKLITRRIIAWAFGGLAIASLGFIVIWDTINIAECNEMASTALGGLIAVVSGIIGYYFAKKTSEE